MTPMSSHWPIIPGLHNAVDHPQQDVRARSQIQSSSISMTEPSQCLDAFEPEDMTRRGSVFPLVLLLTSVHLRCGDESALQARPSPVHCLCQTWTALSTTSSPLAMAHGQAIIVESSAEPANHTGVQDKLDPTTRKRSRKLSTPPYSIQVGPFFDMAKTSPTTRVSLYVGLLLACGTSTAKDLPVVVHWSRLSIEHTSTPRIQLRMH